MFNQEQSVVDRVGEADELLIAPVVLAELYYGAFKSSRSAANLSRIERFLGWVTLVGNERAIAEGFGALKQAFAAQGTPLPDHDIWIAATAIHLQLPLISRDYHFSHVPNLRWEQW